MNPIMANNHCTLFIDQHIAMFNSALASKCNNSLKVAWIHARKAFDSIRHDHLRATVSNLDCLVDKRVYPRSDG